ncbi:MAG: UvrD-helicase domain-containing protein, partial [Rhodocyclales bacterium]|nr:UvrD-helicase domain-containing protein [Rhodocyclales bacterium]
MVKLNPAQLEAVRHLEGPLLVLAGAGSGKTRVITHKIAWLVDEYGITPSHIAAITFTNKAAREMKERVGKLLGGRGEGLLVSTFHALGVRILRQEAAAVGLKRGFSILDAADEFEAAAAKLYADYERTLRAYQAVDFDDLIRLPVMLFSEHDE